MAHGLGFISGSYYDELSGLGRILQPTPFDAYAQLLQDRGGVVRIGPTHYNTVEEIDTALALIGDFVSRL
jgi:selenocysteine lyase/cysteine desulfurase